jgi:hypothetical protein
MVLNLPGWADYSSWGWNASGLFSLLGRNTDGRQGQAHC